MENRTDLAIEFEKVAQKSQTEHKNFGKTGVIFSNLEENNQYGKRKGKYATLKVGDISLLPDYFDIEKALVYCLEKLVPKRRKKVLVAGLGNSEITSDNIGPNIASKILATRHIINDFSKIEDFKNMNSVSVISPSVLGKTGVESSEIISAIVEKIKPDYVIIIDALCACKIENLFSVIQLCDSGISPGSGVKNNRKELSFETLKVPTIAIGVPTVIEANVIAKELAKNENTSSSNLLVTPKDADLLSQNITQAIATGLNVFLQQNIDRETVLNLV